MKTLGQPQNEDERRAEQALVRFKARVGEQARYAPLVPGILMPMHMAVDAAVYSVSAGDAEPAYLLKQFDADALPFVDFSNTVAASELAAGLGLAPTLLAHDSTLNALLYTLLPFGPWRMAMRDDMEVADIRAGVLAATKAWHQSTRLPLTLSPFETITKYVAQVHALADPSRDAAVRLQIPSSFHGLTQWVESIGKAFAAAGSDCGPVHGENTVSNLMIGPGNVVQLVDFDRAVNADPHYDLGALCIEFCIFADDVAAAVEMYAGKASPSITARTQLYMIVDDFLWGCWSLIGHYSSPRNLSIEYFKYAQLRFQRARYCIDRWDVPALIRQM